MNDNNSMFSIVPRVAINLVRRPCLDVVVVSTYHHCRFYVLPHTYALYVPVYERALPDEQLTAMHYLAACSRLL